MGRRLVLYGIAALLSINFLNYGIYHAIMAWLCLICMLILHAMALIVQIDEKKQNIGVTIYYILIAIWFFGIVFFYMYNALNWFEINFYFFQIFINNHNNQSSLLHDKIHESHIASLPFPNYPIKFWDFLQRDSHIGITYVCLFALSQNEDE